MRKPDQNPEPSIEEILASIRKIIADDGTHPSGRAASPPPIDRQSPPVRSADPAPAHRPQMDSFYAEPQEPREIGTKDEEILELTEDFMVEETASGSGGMNLETASVAEAVHESGLAAASVIGDRSPPSGQELESVLSSVVAEVQRLSGGGVGHKAAEEAQTSHDAWAAAPATPAPRTQRQPQPGEWPQSEPSEPKAAPQPSAPQSFRTAPVQRPAPKPIWSARHLDSEGGGGRTAPPRAGQPAAKPEEEPRAPVTGRERWTEGVQMPVPESGPTVPFQQPIPDGDLEPPFSGSGEAEAEIEKEKTFVGEMLTRVFGNTAKKPEEPRKTEAPAPESGRVAKAEELAKTTISDFAKEKLRAPTLADALHADKPFMDAITDSLATAMGETDDEAEAGRQPSAEMPDMPEDDLPEAFLPPDMDLGGFDVPPGQAHGLPGAALGELATPSQAPASQQGAPRDFQDVSHDRQDSLLSEAGQDLRRTHAEMFRVESEAAPAKPAPAKPAAAARPSVPEPAPIFPPASSSVTAAALPNGLEDTIKELIKPLIVQWLNDNLSRIVEKAVREELADQGLTPKDPAHRGSFR